MECRAGMYVAIHVMKGGRQMSTLGHPDGPSANKANKANISKTASISPEPDTRCQCPNPST
jgi:hypothetical protein